MLSPTLHLRRLKSMDARHLALAAQLTGLCPACVGDSPPNTEQLADDEDDSIADFVRSEKSNSCPVICMIPCTVGGGVSTRASPPVRCVTDRVAGDAPKRH